MHHPWIVLPPGIPAVAEFYKLSEYWQASSPVRREALLANSQR